MISAMTPVQGPIRPGTPAIAQYSPSPSPVPVEQSAPVSAATPVNREIQLQVGGGVAVRVTERGGEVRVEVRSPDSQTANALRQELPSLATRLAESGVHASIWHPASASTGSPSLAERSAPSNGEDAGGQQQGRQQRQSDRQPQDEQPEQTTPSAQSNSNRKDFQWLFTSLQ